MAQSRNNLAILPTVVLRLLALAIFVITLAACLAADETPNPGSQCTYNSYDAPCHPSATNLISWRCDTNSGGGNYTRNSTFESNLMNVFSDLISAAAASKSFHNASAGSSGEDPAFGLFYCRGDVDAASCLRCIEAGVSHFTNSCAARGGGAYYELCTLRYDQRAMYGSVELKREYVSCRELFPIGPITGDVGRLNRTIDGAAHRLADRVTSGNTSSYFATEAAKWHREQNVYVLVQCRPDLTLSRCEDCLGEARELMASNCWENGLIWGMYFQPSCQLRYDVVPFFNLTVRASPDHPVSRGPGSPPTNTSNSPGRRPVSRWSHVAATIAIIALIGLYY